MPSSDSRPLQRKMSYRKPAPQYVPSPPTSPRASQPTATEAVGSPDEPENSSLPPLPHDWKHAIHEALGRSDAVGWRKGSAWSESTTLRNAETETIPGDSSNKSVHSFSPSLSRAQSPDRKSHRSWQTYRPPTPPLKGIQRRPHAGDDEISDSQANRHFVVYHDGSNESFTNYGGAPSFVTDKTWESHGVSHIGYADVSHNQSLQSVMQSTPRPSGGPVLPMHVVELNPKRENAQQDLDTSGDRCNCSQGVVWMARSIAASLAAFFTCSGCRRKAADSA